MYKNISCHGRNVLKENKHVWRPSCKYINILYTYYICVCGLCMDTYLHRINVCHILFQFDNHFSKIASHPTGVFNKMPWNFRYWPLTWPAVHVCLEIFMLELDKWVVWQGRRHSKGKPHELQHDLWIKLVFSGICFNLLVYELFVEHGHYVDLGR